MEESRRALVAAAAAGLVLALAVLGRFGFGKALLVAAVGATLCWWYVRKQRPSPSAAALPPPLKVDTGADPNGDHRDQALLRSYTLTGAGNVDDYYDDYPRGGGGGGGGSRNKLVSGAEELANLPLPPKDKVRLVLFDMDLTILHIHTGGAWGGRVAELVPKVSPAFVHLVPRLLAAGFYVGIVTFSDDIMGATKPGHMSGYALVEALLRETFELHFAAERRRGTDGKRAGDHSPASSSPIKGEVDDLVSKVYVACAYPILHQDMPNSKHWHIEKIKGDVEQRAGVRLEPREIVLFDDTVTNVAQARSEGLLAFEVQHGTFFNRDLWLSAVQEMASWSSSSS